MSKTDGQLFWFPSIWTTINNKEKTNKQREEIHSKEIIKISGESSRDF